MPINPFQNSAEFDAYDRTYDDERSDEAVDVVVVAQNDANKEVATERVEEETYAIDDCVQIKV